MSPFETLKEKIRSKKAVVAVVGMGYVGMPLARSFFQAGFSILGFDIDPAKIEKLGKGESYIRHIPSEVLIGMRRAQRFEPTGDPQRLGLADIFLICVPTPLTANRDPDLSYVENTSRSIGQILRAGQLVILISTTYPGTTEEVVKPALDASGLRCGEEYFLAYSPEREDPGNPKFPTEKIPKVVGAVDDKSLQLATALWGTVSPSVIPVSSPKVAEASKLLENIYRCVNIALVNELKIVFEQMKIDVWEVIAAASTKPFGFQPFTPGPGMGGHCIPIDPFYLSWKAKQHDATARFIELAGELNMRMPYHIVTRTAEVLNDRGKTLRGANVLVVGVAYKRDVDDIRESPALKILELLQERGALVQYHDPYIPRFPQMRASKLRMESVPLTRELLERQDAVLIVTDHSVLDVGMLCKHSKLVIDTRNVTGRMGKRPPNVVMA